MQFIVEGRVFDDVREAEAYEQELKTKKDAELMEKNEKAEALFEYLKDIMNVAQVQKSHYKVTYLVFDKDSEERDKHTQAFIYKREGVPCTLDRDSEYVKIWEPVKLTQKQKLARIKQVADYLAGVSDKPDFYETTNVVSFMPNSIKRELHKLTGVSDLNKFLCSNPIPLDPIDDLLSMLY